jgi:molecular chaperone DnaK (HSP70)
MLCHTQARSGIVAVLDIGGRGMTCSLVDVQSGSDSTATPWGTVVATERCDSVGGEYIEELLVTEVSSQKFNCNQCHCNYHRYH